MLGHLAGAGTAVVVVPAVWHYVRVLRNVTRRTL